ncbi:hypothetical protein QOT17_001172 [Balamuthia mandrillaris]
MSAPLSQRTRALGAFKQLVRTQRTIFASDTYAQSKAMEKIRAEFMAHKEESDAGKIDNLIQQAEDASVFLRDKVLQGKLDERNNAYVVEAQRKHLRFHDPMFEGTTDKNDESSGGQAFKCCSS